MCLWVTPVACGRWGVPVGYRENDPTRGGYTVGCAHLKTLGTPAGVLTTVGQTVSLVGPLALVRPVVDVVVGGFGQHELGDACPPFESDRVVDLQEPLAFALVAGVPDGRVEHTRVPHQGRSGIEEPDVAVGNRDRLRVLKDVPARIEFEDVAGGVHGFAVANRFSVDPDAAGFDLFEDVAESEVDAVRLYLPVGDRFDVRGDERTGAKHTGGPTSERKAVSLSIE